jgi:hypothetical protein
MSSLTEAELSGRVAADVERRRRIPFPLIAVRRGVDDEDAGSGRDVGAGDLVVIESFS